MDRWMDKDVVHIYNGILLSHKEEWKSAIYNNVGGPRGYYAKWNKSDRERQIFCVIKYVELKKKDQRQSEVYLHFMCVCSWKAC